MTLIDDRITQLLADDPDQFQTPCYVYSVSGIKHNVARLEAETGTPVIASCKANHCLDLLTRWGAESGVEVASVGELNLVSGGNGPRYVNNPSADKALIRAAVQYGATIIVDHPEQLELVSSCAGQRTVAPVVFRLNRCVLRDFGDDTVGARGDHFGMDWATIEKAIPQALELGLEVGGFHAFKGSYSFRDGAFAAANAARAIHEAFEQRVGAPVPFVNLGGGFPEDWESMDFDFAAYRELLARFPDHVRIIHESGRGQMGNAGVFLTRVRYIKQVDGQRYAVCDGGMAQNFLLAQTENVFRRHASPRVFDATERADRADPGEDVTLMVGTSCSKDDVIGRTTAPVEVGDLLVFRDNGAYNQSYTVSPFLMLPEPNTYVVE